jgi:two-component system LytT family response regulator
MHTRNQIPVLILNDGSPEKELLRRYICSHQDLGIVHECDDLETAREKITASNPVLVFLNSEKPGQTVLKFLDELSTASGPLLILVTACHESAAKAFDSRVLDCLQKPMVKERFDRAIERVREHIRRDGEAELGRLVHGILESKIRESDEDPQRPDSGFLERLTIKEAGRVLFVPTSDIDYIEASGNYMAVLTGTKTHLVYETMAQMEAQLDPARFLRIHRSHIVNIGRIRELQPYFNGEYIVLLGNGTKLKISRSYRESARAALGLA